MPSPHYHTANLLERTARYVLAEEALLGLTPHQWAVLRYLHDVPQEERTIGKAAANLSVDHSLARKAVWRLARKGLLDAGGTSATSKTVGITPEGAAIMTHDPVRQVAHAMESRRIETRPGTETWLVAVHTALSDFRSSI